jgi:hypothetical protein
VCVLARVFEEAGLPTVSLALVREHAEKVKPSRALFVPFPFGYPLGKPNDASFQHRVLRAAFDLLQAEEGPVLTDFPEETGSSVLPQASSVQTTLALAHQDPADEVTALRPFYERWLEMHKGRTAIGLTGIPQRRFRGMIRFMQSYARSEACDMKERPKEISVPQFLRYCVDDLKAFYYEARMMQRPTTNEPALHTWFWGETAAGKLVADIANRMQATEDAMQQGIAYGIAR